jgi:LCP family protein required for cell wall assembly
MDDHRLERHPSRHRPAERFGHARLLGDPLAMMSTSLRKRSALVVIAALLAWVAGTIAGNNASTSTAQAAPLFTFGLAHPGEAMPMLNGTQPIHILVIGSGARPGETYYKNLADSIHIVGINPQAGRAAILGIPRDSWVPVPGAGMQKINAAMVYGGPQGMVKEVEAVTGIHIDFYAITSFWGFTNAVNRVGGVSVYVPYGGMHDPYSRTNFSGGIHHLSGADALAYSRDRHSVPNGDFSRSCDGAIMLQALQQQFRRQFAVDPSRLLTYLAAGLWAASQSNPNVYTDVPYQDLLTLAFTAANIPLKKVQLIVAPGSIGTAGGGTISTVNLLPTDKATVFADMEKNGYFTHQWKGAYTGTALCMGGNG